MEKPIVLLSGGFDPYHDGHAKMFQAAAEIGDICVILNSDDWLIRKKGNCFMNLVQRANVLNSIKGVILVWESKTTDDVSRDIEDISKRGLFLGRAILFGNGGDRTPTNTPEQAICEELSIPVIFGLGGSKSNSSSSLLHKWTDTKNCLSASTMEAINAWGGDGSMA